MKNDDLGNRLKAYEDRETGRSFLPYIPVYARIDGRGFSKFTRRAIKPYDEIIAKAMSDTATELVRQTNAEIAYVQSDEISLVWQTTEPGEELLFRGKVQKMVSVLAGMASSAFILSLLKSDYSAWVDRLPHFDARVIQLPNETEAANMFLWREMDARKNAISMAAHRHFSHASLQGLSGREKVAKMAAAGIVFDDYPLAFRRGTFLRREVINTEVTNEMSLKMGKIEPGTMVKRTVIRALDMPQFNHVENRTGVIFRGEAPVVIP